MKTAIVAIGVGALIGAALGVGIFYAAMELMDGRAEIAWLT